MGVYVGQLCRFLRLHRHLQRRGRERRTYCDSSGEEPRKRLYFLSIRQCLREVSQFLRPPKERSARVGPVPPRDVSKSKNEFISVE